MSQTRQDRLRAWLNKHRPRVHGFRLVFEDLGVAPMVLGEWPRDYCEGITELASTIASDAQDHCDAMERSAVYRIEALSAEGKIITHVNYKVLANAAIGDEPLSRAAATASEAQTQSQIVKHFLDHDTAGKKIQLGTLSALLGAYQQVLAQLQAANVTLSQENLALRQMLRDLTGGGAGAEDTEEARVEHAARAAAWNKLAELAQQAAPYALEFVQSKLNGGGGLPQ